MKSRWILIVAVAIAATALGFYYGQSKVTSPLAATDIAPEAAARLMNMTVSTPQGEAVQLKQWAGKVLVVNFWATWCPPCREEMPEFSRVQTQLADKGVQFVGIGIDTPDNIINFENNNAISYPLLIGAYDLLKITADLGNKSSALPFTVILDRTGRIAHSKMGKLDETELLRLLAPLHTTVAQ
jgi:thiol-disulfide isomerase/thioredoxin